MEGRKEGLACEELKPFVCVEDAEDYLRSMGVDVEELLKKAMERVGELKRMVESGSRSTEDG